MKLFLIQKLIFTTLAVLVFSMVCIQLDDNRSENSNEYTSRQVEKRFLNARFGSGLNFEQLRRVSKYFRGQQMKYKQDEKKKSHIY